VFTCQVWMQLIDIMALFGSKVARYPDLPSYENPPPWIPQQQRLGNRDYDNDLRLFMTRRVILRRNQITDTLGFNVRGGEDRRCGIYISWVKPGTEAEAQGLKESDQILEVNGVNFETLDHTEAVSILKGNLEVDMMIRYFPYGYRKTYDQMPSNVPPSNVAG